MTSEVSTTGSPEPPAPTVVAGSVDEANRNSALDQAISADRYASYLLAAGNDKSLARALYIWDRNLAVAILGDLAIVEVAMRNAMHNALSSVWGSSWYANPSVVLDDRSQSQLAGAWKYLARPVRNDPTDGTVPGRLVSQCMFGFWTNLLDAGDYSGRDPRRLRVDYEDLWRPALHKAFPGGRVEARNDPDPTARFTRSWTHGIAKHVNALRNRVAHHEPLLNGFPLPGQQSRMTATQGHLEYLRLARMIDRNLADWITHDTRVLALLSARPS